MLDLIWLTLLFSLRIVMATPRVLLLGHSFLKRMHQLIRNPSNALREDLGISLPCTFKWHGIGGRTVAKVLHNDLGIVKAFSPDVVILQLGTNDLSQQPAATVGSQIEDLVRHLHDHCGVKLIYVCQTIRRETASVGFNAKTRLLIQYLRVVLEPLPYAIYWAHRGFWNTSSRIFLHDGVHLNGLGQYKLYRSYRGAVLNALRLIPSPT